MSKSVKDELLALLNDDAAMEELAGILADSLASTSVPSSVISDACMMSAGRLNRTGTSVMTVNEYHEFITSGLYNIVSSPTANARRTQAAILIKKARNINIVTCGECGDPFIHDTSPELDELECPYCKFSADPSAFPDLFY